MSSSAPATIPTENCHSGLTRELRLKLWSRMLERLENGEVLITSEHYRQAMESEYADLAPTPPTGAVIAHIRRMVKAVNTTHPETYVKQGAQNAVSRALRATAVRSNWTWTDLQAKGTQAAKELLKGGALREVLEEAGIDARAIDPVPIVRALVESARSEEEDTDAQVALLTQDWELPAEDESEDEEPSPN